jgi:hypothetical protein
MVEAEPLTCLFYQLVPANGQVRRLGGHPLLGVQGPVLASCSPHINTQCDSIVVKKWYGHKRVELRSVADQHSSYADPHLAKNLYADPDPFT